MKTRTYLQRPAASSNKILNDEQNTVQTSQADLPQPQQAILQMQQQSGNDAVRRHLAGSTIQRAVQIDEMTSNIEVRDEANLSPDVANEVKNAMPAAQGSANGNGPVTIDEVETSVGSEPDSTLDMMNDTPNAYEDENTRIA